MKSCYIGRATYSFMTISAHHYQRRLLCTKTKKASPIGLKAEVERKFIQANVIPNVINNRQIKTGEDWKNIRNDLFQSGKQITPLTVDSLILNYCINSKSYDLGYRYMEFLKKEDIKPGLAAIGKYFRLFYNSNVHGNLSENQEQHILTIYKELRSFYKVFDASTCENVIQALSLTKEWKECLKLIDEIKITCNPSSLAYSVTAAAAFRDNESDLAWKLLNEIVDKDHSPHSIAYISYLNLCGNSTGNLGISKLEELFEFFQVNDIKCDHEVAQKISDVFKKSHLNASTTMITHSGVCLSCNKKLNKLELNEQEFEDLKTAIFKNVIVGKNVFYKTTPEELKNFENFIAKMEKYDVVIDGLNVAYSAGVKQSPYVLSSLVTAVVKHFVNQNKRVLVLGRTHMRKWSKSNWSYVTQNADTFLAQTLSQDDPYLLYCALNSGLNTIIVTRDLMRSHLFKLKDPRLKLLFNQWLTLSQYQLQHVNNQGKTFFKYPPLYSRTAQKVENVWHIPYSELSNGTAVNKWLCVCT